MGTPSGGFVPEAAEPTTSKQTCRAAYDALQTLETYQPSVCYRPVDDIRRSDLVASKRPIGSVQSHPNEAPNRQRHRPAAVSAIPLKAAARASSREVFRVAGAMD